MVTALIIAGAYLWGAVPSAYLAGRFLKGIDIRDYGSGNVGAANVGEHVGRWTGIGLGAFDMLGKGTLPIVVARLLDQSLAAQGAVGAAAIAGHNWSPYIRFTGGRGIATAMGALVGLSMWLELLTVAVLFGWIGRSIYRETGLWTLVSMVVVPLLAYVYGRPEELVYATVGFGALIALKRLTANWEMPRGEHGLARVLTYRLTWDRDVPRKAQWTARRPPTERRG